MYLKIFLKGLRKAFFLIPFLFAFNIHAQIYLDSTASIDDRVNDLLGRMTLEEKVGQMTQIDLSHVLNNPEIVANYYLGSLLSGGGSTPSSNTPTAWADMYDLMQQSALSTRLKIPIIYGIDAVHGHNNLKDAVIFPHNIGLGSTRNPELVEEIGRITAIEVAATGIDWTFAPCIAVPQDERWGRTYEGFGETPELAEELGSAYVKGIQGDTLSKNTSILACAKHFIGDGGTTDGDDQGTTQIDEATLREIHLPGYIEAIKNNVGSIMATYNSWNGNKVHGSHYLLTDLLKGELGFEGFVVSDWAAIDQLPGNYKSDVKESINAGIDMVMVPDRYEEFITDLISLVNSGDVSIERIDNAVSRILRIKFMMGLFEHTFTDRSLITSVGSQDHRDVARQAVRESLVLLKKKDDVLPLSSSSEKIFVAGLGADDIGMQCGGWTISWQGSLGEITKGTTILEGIKNVTGSANVIYNEEGETTNEFDKAIVVIGEHPYAEGNGDREDLTISDDDIELVKKVHELGKPVVVILLSGRPMIINPILHYSDAIISAWLPGTEGDGIADILFGENQPSGKLGHSWPKYMEQIPINVGDENYDPLFEYGYGLTSLENSESGSDPIFYSAIVNDIDNTLEIAFNKSINSASISECTFQFFVDGQSTSIQQTPTMVEGKDDVIKLQLSTEVSKDQQLSISLLTGTIESVDGGILQPFNQQFVYNGYNDALEAFFLPGKIEAEDYHFMSGVQTENTIDSGGGLNVGWIDNGDWLKYYVNITQTGTYKVSYRIAAQSQNGILTLKKNDEILESKILPITYEWQNWQTVTSDVVMPKGTYFLELYAEQGGFNLNWFSVDLTSNVNENNMHSGFALYQNYPNPFNPATTIKYSVPSFSRSVHTKLIVYNSLGQKVATLVDEYKNAGTYEIQFDGSQLVSGVYFCRLTSGNFTDVSKIVLIK